MNGAELAVVIILIIIMYLVCLPMVIYWSIQLFQQQTKPCVFRRHPFIIYLISIFMLIYIALDRPLYLFDSLLRHQRLSLLIVESLFYEISFYGFFFAFLWRCWIVFYDCHWLIALEKQDWQSIIVGNDDPNYRDFFIENRTTIGNWLTIGKYIAAVWFVTVLTHIIVYSLLPHSIAAPIIDVIIMGIVIVVVLCLYFRVSYLAFDDYIFICRELELEVRVGGIGVFLYILSVILDTNTNISKFGVEVIRTILGVSTLTGITLLQTQWVLYQSSHLDTDTQCDNDDNDGRDNSPYHNTATMTASAVSNTNAALNGKKGKAPNIVGSSDSMSDVSSGRSQHKSPPRVTYDTPELHMRAILQNMTDIQSFIQHLEKEFCVENILGLIEIYQFVSVLRDVVPPETMVELRRGADPLHLNWHPNIPQSKIANEMSPFTVRHHQLYKKYIAVGSTYELNLSFLLRKKFETLNTPFKRLGSIRSRTATNIFGAQISFSEMLWLYEQVLDKIFSDCIESVARFNNNQHFISKHEKELQIATLPNKFTTIQSNSTL